ncbi:hypothetical protein FBY35_0499 [Streptomyces sp. SLBN-118]|nr:hypothetical protein FBY35_0499 [Streptomyces sp. SLBN-118]
MVARRRQRLDSPTMTNPDEQGRPQSPVAADETATLLGLLEYRRATSAGSRPPPAPA